MAVGNSCAAWCRPCRAWDFCRRFSRAFSPGYHIWGFQPQARDALAARTITWHSFGPGALGGLKARNVIAWTEGPSTRSTKYPTRRSTAQLQWRIAHELIDGRREFMRGRVSPLQGLGFLSRDTRAFSPGYHIGRPSALPIWR